MWRRKDERLALRPKRYGENRAAHVRALHYDTIRQEMLSVR